MRGSPLKHLSLGVCFCCLGSRFRVCFRCLVGRAWSLGHLSPLGLDLLRHPSPRGLPFWRSTHGSRQSLLSIWCMFAVLCCCLAVCVCVFVSCACAARTQETYVPIR